MKKKLCLISTTASYYRTPIYKLIDERYETSFFFSERFENIKLMDYSLLKGKVKEVKTWHGRGFLYQFGLLSQLFKDYDAYITLGYARCISTWFFLILAKLMHKRVYAWTHGWYGKESHSEIRFKKIFFRLPSGILLYGNYAKGLMIEQGFNINKLHVIHNSLDYKVHQLLRDSIESSDVYVRHFGNKNSVIILICRLTKRKRIDLLIEALSILKKKGINYNAVIVGDGEEKENLKRIIAASTLENQVWLYGACYDEKENAKLIYNADVCVTPGDVGLTAIHTMTFGVPVITHNNYPFQGPEFEAIREGQTGAFYEYGNVESLATTIHSWLSKKQADREKVRSACYNEIDTQWTPDYQMRVIESVID